ncbi:MAG TPA: type III pantothenate kinase [Bacteroidales bacterium]|nr:type III pantothenate kinase [Bacteroidales bacterium]
MNLVIDLGNTTCKIAVCEGIEIIESAVSEKVSNREIAYFISKYDGIRSVIFSSVTNHSRELTDYLRSSFDYFLELNPSTPLPIKNHYQTPKTLGYDRVAAVSGAHTIFHDHDVLVIDAGTAVTFDFITANGEYMGGNISPGLEMRFKALNKYSSRLPYLHYHEMQLKELGETTEQAVISGVFNGLLYEIEYYISLFSAKHPDLKTIITGGDAISFDKKLKNSIFVLSHLNLIGLNRILDYNAQKFFKN